MLTDLFRIPPTQHRERASVLPHCGACRLFKTCQSPKMPVAGKGRRSILIVGEAPGENEDIQGRPFVGKAGKYLEECLLDAGIDLRRDCWVTNSLICRPPRNATPSDRQIDYCRPNVVNAVKKYAPEVVVPVGLAAMKSVLKWLWPTQDVDGVTRWVGRQIPAQKINAWVCPCFHPSYVLRSERNGRLDELLVGQFRKHLNAVAELKGRPWAKVPDHRSMVSVVLNPEEVAKHLHYFKLGGLPLAVDIETDRIKPDSEEASIHSCAFSDGFRTVSFPWFGKAIRAVAELFESSVPIIAHNAKFEDRWFRAKIGAKINWSFCTMMAAHALDSRRKTKGLDFLAAAVLGEPEWSSHIDPYLRSKGGGNTPNRIRELDLRQLLLYGGLDTLLTHKIAQIQAKQLGVKLSG